MGVEQVSVDGWGEVIGALAALVAALGGFALAMDKFLGRRLSPVTDQFAEHMLNEDKGRTEQHAAAKAAAAAAQQAAQAALGLQDQIRDLAQTIEAMVGDNDQKHSENSERIERVEHNLVRIWPAIDDLGDLVYKMGRSLGLDLPTSRPPGST